MGYAGARAGRADGVRRADWRDAGVLQSALRLMPPTGLRYRFHTIGIGAGFRRCGPVAWPNRAALGLPWTENGGISMFRLCSDGSSGSISFGIFSTQWILLRDCDGADRHHGIRDCRLRGGIPKTLEIPRSHVFMVRVGIPPAPDSAGVPPRLRNSPQSPMVWNSDHRMTALCTTGGRMCVQYHLLPG